MGGMNGKFALRRTPIGLGLFTSRRIPKGDFVIEYTGRLLSNAEADYLNSRYLFQVNRRWTIDGSGRENLSRYINHSCRPNCVAYTSRRKVFIYAKRAIAPGEELSYDYGKEYFDEFIKPKGCACLHCAKKNGRSAPGARRSRRTGTPV
jgi:hypothetical protein